MADYSREQIYDAMRRADAAGDAEAVKALIAQLEAPDTATTEEQGLTGTVSYTPPKPTEAQPSKMEYLGQATENAVAGAAQGVAGIYDMAQSVAKAPTYAMNALARVAGQGANAIGLDTVGNALIRGADNYDRDLGNVKTVSGLIEQASPTPEGMGAQRFAAQFLGGSAVPFGPKAAPKIAVPKAAPVATEAQQVVQAGNEAGVRVLTSDVRQPRSFTGKVARATGERIPYAGTGGVRVKQNEERINAVKDLARDFGIDGSQEFLSDVTDDLAKTRGGKIVALKGRKDRVIQGIAEPFVAAPNTVRAVNEQVRKLQGIDAEVYAPVIERLQRFGEQVTAGKSLEQIEGQRKLLGDLFADQSLAAIKGDGQKALNAIYGPLREDMGAFIKANAGDDAFNAWKRSNDELAAMAGELDAKAFKKVLNDAQATPENVAGLLFSQKPSDVRRLYANLSSAGQEKAKAAVLFEAVRKSGGLDEVSPQKFANSLKAFGRTTGIIFGNDAPRIEGIVRLLRATQQASVAAAAPPTGVQNSQIIGATGLTASLGLWAGAGVAGAAGLAARLYESAPVRNLLIGLGRTKPGTPQEGKMLERLGKAFSSQSGIAGANDNVATIGSAVASGGAEPQGNN